jgi:hypothetical protein
MQVTDGFDRSDRQGRLAEHAMGSREPALTEQPTTVVLTFSRKGRGASGIA